MDTPPQHAETTPPEPAGKPQITIDDFLKIDLRVATVKSATAHPNADKLIVLQLDDGTENGRQICAGLRGIYEPDQLVGKQIVVVANLAPRKMRGETSEGMLLAASDDGRSNVVLVSPAGDVAPGSGVG